MSLSTIEASLREDITTVEARVRSILDEHLPALATAAADAESDPIAQALENTFLDDDEKTLVASLISKLGTAAKDVQAAESEPAASETPAEPEPTAEVPQPVAAGPTVGGAAT
jgi:hypothetical protein